MGDIAHMQADEIAAPQFAVDGQVEHGKVADGMRILEVDTDGPDVLWLKGRLLAYELSLVPGFALVDSFHFRLLGC
jgi:hypothetical protein